MPSPVQPARHSLISTAPVDFDAHAFFQGIYTFQSWEIFPGVRTQGPKDVQASLASMQFPADLTGLRVLDIAPWNGFFSFECARRGASEVVSLGPEDPYATGFAQTRELLQANNVRYVRGSVYDISRDELGTFDIVLFLGLIYHLRHPLLALDKIHDVCSNKVFVDTPYLDNIVWDRTIAEDVRVDILANRSAFNALPMLYYTPAAETGDPYNWFIPNLLALRAMVASSGFDVVFEGNDGNGWCWLTADRAERPFELGLEGYNKAAASS